MKKNSPSYQIEKNVKRWFAVLQLISKRLAFMHALRIFFTPIAYPTPKREADFANTYERTVEHVNGKPFEVFNSTNSAKKVLLVHGWSGRASQFYALAHALTQQGFQVFTFTAPGHGSKPLKRTRTHMLEFADCITLLTKKYGRFEAVIAHSIGGAAALNALATYAIAKKIVLVGVPGHITEIVNDFCTKLGLNNAVRSMLLDNLAKRYGADFERFSATERAKEVVVPALIIHDIHDEDVPVTYAHQNHEALRDSVLIKTEGLGHRKILADKKVMEAMCSFVAAEN